MFAGSNCGVSIYCLRASSCPNKLLEKAELLASRLESPCIQHTCKFHLGKIIHDKPGCVFTDNRGQ